MKKLTIAILSLLWAVSAFAQSDFSIALYHPDKDLKERVGGGVQEVAAFVKTVNQVWNETIPSNSERKQSAIVVGLGFNRQATAWVINGNESASETATMKLREHKSPWISGGYFAFALIGADYIHESDKEFSPPTPEEWATVVSKESSRMTVDDILAVLLTKDDSFEKSVPDDFELQLLEPLGGKILRPKNWYYTEGHRDPSYNWIISKEDVRKGPYDTGVRIQTLVGIQKETGQSPKDFVLDFYEQKKNSVQKVYKTCDPQDQGLFTRICLEVDEGAYRILYSLFWGNRVDLVVVSTAGAKKEDWPTYEPIFNRMAAFELIDMKRFEEK